MPVDPLPHIPNGIDLRRLRAFAALITYGKPQAAADALGLTREGVAKPVRELQKAFGGRPLTELRGDHVVATPLGAEVHQAAIDILNRIESLERLPPRIKPVTTLAYLPHHAEFVEPLLATARAKDDYVIEAEILEEQHRAAEVFQQTVIGGLTRGVYDVVVGPPPTPERAHNLHAQPLYRCCMVALVQAEDPDELTFADAANRALLLPPDDTRAGLAIRGALDAETPPGAAPMDNIVKAAYSTSALIIGGRAGLGTVIVPSDISFAYSPNGTLYGPFLHHMKWVPLRTTDTHLLTHTVYATTRRRFNNDPGVRAVVHALQHHISKLISPHIELTR